MNKMSSESTSHIRPALILGIIIVIVELSMCGYIAYKKSIYTLRSYLDSKDPRIQEYALHQIINLNDRKSIPRIRSLTTVGSGVRSLAINALRIMEDKEFIPELHKMFYENVHQDDVIVALAKFGDREFIPQIRELLGSTDAREKAIAIYALGKLNDHESIEQIRTILAHEKDSCVRAMAIMALGSLNDTDSIPDIRMVLYSKEYELEGVAIEALAKLGDRESLPEIRRKLSEGMHKVACCRAIALFNDRESIPDVRNLLKDGWVNDSNIAAITLIELGENNDIPQRVIDEIKLSLRFKRDLSYDAYSGLQRNAPDNTDEYLKQAEAALKKIGVSDVEIKTLKEK